MTHRATAPLVDGPSGPPMTADLPTDGRAGAVTLLARDPRQPFALPEPTAALDRRARRLRPGARRRRAGAGADRRAAGVGGDARRRSARPARNPRRSSTGTCSTSRRRRADARGLAHRRPDAAAVRAGRVPGAACSGCSRCSRSARRSTAPTRGSVLGGGLRGAAVGVHEARAGRRHGGAVRRSARPTREDDGAADHRDVVLGAGAGRRAAGADHAAARPRLGDGARARRVRRAHRRRRAGAVDGRAADRRGRRRGRSR